MDVLWLNTTSYQYSYPFLPQFHQDASEEAIEAPLVTTGEGVLNLYRDIFYNPDPTPAFLGLSVNTSAFSFFEYQSISIARVFAGTARLPSLSARQAAYTKMVQEKGEGKFAHFMGQQGERSYVRDTVAWLNKDAGWSGTPLVEGHSEEWIKSSDGIPALMAKRYELTEEVLEKLRPQPSKLESVGAVSESVVIEKLSADLQDELVNRSRSLVAGQV
jgi:hypothetical protein